MAGRRGRKVYASARWQRTRNLAIIRARFTCQKCHRAGVDLEAHHRVPLAEGGAAYEQANIVVVCRRCHLEEHGTPTPPEVLAWEQLVLADA